MKKKGRIEEKEFKRQQDKIINILKCALNTNYYKKLFLSNDIKIQEISTYDDFQKIPFTQKEHYRDNWHAFVDKDIIKNIDLNKLEKMSLFNRGKLLKKDNLFRRSTSGSTGVPMEILKHKKDRHREFFILNQYRNQISPNIYQRSFVWILPANQIIRETFNLGKYKKYGCGYKYFMHEFSDDCFSKFFNFLSSKEVKWISGQPSILAHFANYLIENNINELIKLEYIECNSEYLFDWQRNAIQNAFNIMPRSIYASNEVQFIAGTCQNNKMHIFENSVFIEIVKNEIGISEIVATTLIDKFAPFIRYRIGDCAEWSETVCSCGKKSPVVKLKGYRTNDLIITKNQTKIEHFIISDSFMFLKENEDIEFEQYQVIQKDVDNFFYIVKLRKSTSKDKIKRVVAFLEDYFTQILGYPTNVDINVVNNIIPNDPISGKFKYFICNVNDKK